MPRNFILAIFLLSANILNSHSSIAFSQNHPDLSIAKRCHMYFDYYEKKFALPKHLLYSVSLAESGRIHKQSNKIMPWPWAVNISGKSFYFSSKTEALNEIQKAINNGITNIDIGCMQINIKYHSSNFLNISMMIEPRNNIEYAATLLKRNHEKYNNWPSAIADYHSASHKGINYSQKVLLLWHKIKSYASNK